MNKKTYKQVECITVEKNIVSKCRELVEKLYAQKPSRFSFTFKELFFSLFLSGAALLLGLLAHYTVTILVVGAVLTSAGLVGWLCISLVVPQNTSSKEIQDLIAVVKNGLDEEYTKKEKTRVNDMDKSAQKRTSVKNGDKEVNLNDN